MKLRSLICLLVLLGCSRPRPSLHVVVLIDVSGSIEPNAESKAYVAIDELIRNLRRGDKVSIIPITADAFSDSPGRILRFTKPTKREAYDADLARFAKKVSESLDELRVQALSHPGAKSDILGAVAMAEQEIATDPEGAQTQLEILSDFIQEDDQYNFKNDEKLSNKGTAQKLAQTLATSSQERIFSSAFLGLVRSRDAHALDSGRRDAIQEFWRQYLGRKANVVQFATDGPGLLNRQGRLGINTLY